MMSTKVRTYNELRRFKTFEERYEYLKLVGEVGKSTFGFDRWINQQFYQSREWRRVRQIVILRDRGCDLGIDGYDIHKGLIIHHMNPMTEEDLLSGNDSILDPLYLITTSHKTHNAIHYGDERLLSRTYTPRTPGDTKLW